jgi:hypothetical protein
MGTLCTALTARIGLVAGISSQRAACSHLRRPRVLQVCLVLLSVCSQSQSAWAQDCTRTSLVAENQGAPRLYWANSAVWLPRPEAPGESRLLVLDLISAKVSWLVPGLAGQPLRIDPTEANQAFAEAKLDMPMQLRPSPDGTGVVVRAPEGLVELDSRLRRKGTFSVIAGGATKPNEALELNHVWDYAPTTSGLLAYGDFCVRGHCASRKPEDWSSAFLFRRRSLETAEPTASLLLPQVGMRQDIRQFYLDSFHYIAVVGQTGFLLDLSGATPLIRRYQLNSAGAPRPLEPIPVQSPWKVPQLNGVMTLRAPVISTEFFRRIQSQQLPVSLHAWRGSLYLLAKGVMDPRTTRTLWTLVRIDPTTGAEQGRVELPVSSPHLTVAPGPQWAFLEKSQVQGIGPTQFPSFETRALVLLDDAKLQQSFQPGIVRSLRDACF